MKQSLIYIIQFISFFSLEGVTAQEAEVEKYLWGVQIDPLAPLSVYNELRLDDNIALRSELSAGYGIWDDNWILIPNLSIEPRFYYNLGRRVEKSKRVDNNSANYFSLRLKANSQASFSDRNDINVFPAIAIIPNYGFRRNIGRHFNFEFGFGVGYRWIFQEFERKHLDNTISLQKSTLGKTDWNLRIALGLVF